MRTPILSPILVAWLFLFSTTNAAVFERDWLAPGDGILTFDDVNQREWLDLSETLLQQFPGADLEARYQGVISELSLGGMFEGFAVAESDDVIALAQSAGIDTSIAHSLENLSPTSRLIELLSITVDSSTSDQMRSMGFLGEFSTFPDDLFGPRRLIAIASIFSCAAGCSGVLVVGGEDLVAPETMGVMLFRNAIPEPSTLIMLTGFISLHLGIHPNCWQIGGAV